MSEPQQAASPDQPDRPAPFGAVEPLPVAPTPTRRRRPLALILACVAALLVGAVVATTVFLVVGNDQHRYAISVFLTRDATAEQRTAVESALRGLHPVDGIRFETSQQAWEKYKEMFKDRKDLLDAVKPDTLPASYRLTTKAKEFDCAPLVPIKRLPGVDEITVAQLPSGKHPGAVVGCG